MLPFEVMHGMKFDVNRAFGNGQDDDGDGLVDEADEVGTERAWGWLGVAGANPVLSTPFQNVLFTHGNGDLLTISDRQIYARHLYCLMMALIDHPHALGGTEYGFRFTMNAGGSGARTAANRELTARRIAQWCVNVVDFRDADSTMTGFEFDIDPFDANGWSVDGNVNSIWTPGPDGQWGVSGVDDDSNGTPDDITEAGWNGSDDRSDLNPGRDGAWGVAGVDDNGTSPTDDVLEAGYAGSDDTLDARVSWGCENPDLLISETIAFHDRRVKDSKYDNTMEERWEAGMIKDDDLDQYRKPEGSLILELYCPAPRYANNQRLRTELYQMGNGLNGTATEVFLNLGKVVAPNAGNGTTAPVWRVGISASHHTGAPGSRAALNPLTIRVAGGRPDSVTFQPDKYDLLRTTPNLPLERFVVFANTAGTTLDSRAFPNSAGTVFYNRTSNTFIEAGTYAVVGPRKSTFIGVEKIIPGSANSAAAYQKIVLDPAAPNNAVARHYYDAAGVTQTDDSMMGGRKLVTPFIVASAPPWGAAGPDLGIPGQVGVGLNVSEPLGNNYYDQPTATYHSSLPQDSYFDPNTLMGARDTPFDSDPGRGYPLYQDFFGAGRPNKLETGTTLGYKTAFLQRLADPSSHFDPSTNPYITVDWMSIDLTIFNGQDEQPSTWDKTITMEDWDPIDPDPFGAPVNEFFDTRKRDGQTTYNIWTQSFAQPGASYVPNMPKDYFAQQIPTTASLGYINKPMTAIATAGQFLGDPSQPFPWLAWNDRPYANPYELMLVPASSPSRLLHEFSTKSTTLNAYQDADGVFGHLLNFYRDRGLTPTVPSSNFHRIFECMEVPSRYVGTETWYDPQTFSTGVGVEYYGFRPPFNRLSRFRDPGIINVNTIANREVWQAYTASIADFSALQLPSGGGTFWDTTVEANRKGHYTGGQTYPSSFARPFRSDGRGDLAPHFEEMRANRTVSGTKYKSPIAATVMRPTDQSDTDPMFELTSTDAANNTARSPTFLHQGIQKAASGVSTHSNVFAVWVTVGFFDVEPNPTGVDLGHPDGYRFCNESGSEDGSISRHRSFYILDRSAPVGFVPGEDLNSDEAILLRRHIE